MRRGRGYAPPFAGRLLGANGSGRRIMTGGRIRRRGKGIFDTIKHYGKKLFDFVKGNKDIQEAGKQGLSFLGSKAKDVIEAKSKSLVRQYNKENVDKPTKKQPAYIKNPAYTGTSSSKKPILPPAVQKRRAEVVARKAAAAAAKPEERTFAPVSFGGRGIRRIRRRMGGVILQKTKRIGRHIKNRFNKMRGKGLPMVPLAFQ